MMTTIERRQRILEILSVYRSTTLQSLANELNVSLMTIRRDIEFLTCSAPIYTILGNGGGIRVADGWYLSKTYLRDEQEQLLRNLLPTLPEKDQQTLNGILQMFAKPKVKA